MMSNNSNKGFTVVELIASFALTMVIAVFLFEVLIEVKDIYAETALKTKIQEKMGIVSKNINKQINKEGGNIVTVDSANNKLCTVNSKNIVINNNSISIAGQTLDMPASTSISQQGNTDYIKNSCDGNDCYLSFAFNIDSKVLQKPYNYNVIYYYIKQP